MSFYPTSNQIKENWIPDSLHYFLEAFTKSKVKQESIGQCIVKAALPKNSLPPLLFGLGVELDHLYGSKWLTDELFKLGFSVSYGEVLRYKQAVVMTQTLDDQINSLKGSFTQFVADNVDHNTATIDGHGTFHGMGIIASTITNTSNIINEIRIKRPEKLFKVEHLSNQNIIPIIPYDFPSQKRINSIALKPILKLSYPYVLPNSLNTDIIWHSASITSTESKPRANWSG